MTEDKGFPVSIDDLLAQIRSEVSARNAGKVLPAQKSACPKHAPSGAPCPSTTQAELEPALEPALEPQPFEWMKERYHINDFLKYQDQDFVLNAYRGILRREADPAGLHAHIEELRQGRVSKVELLGRLRYSPEGRMKATKVSGLGLRFVAQTLFRIPVLGYLGQWLSAIIMLPVLVRNLQKLDCYSHTQFDRLNRQNHRMNQLMAANLERVDVRQLREDVLQLRELKADQADVQAILSDEEAHLLDGFYVALEDAARGSREAVKEELKVYLPYVSSVGPNGATPAVLDLGCGRGEWLEMLREQGFSGHGVDINRVALAICRALGLEVTEGDAIAFLKAQKPDSFEVVTGFHLIEHFDLKTWIQLLDETLRVLKPGGMLLLQTPNPLSLRVALGGFYRDPARRLPVHPDTVRLMAETRGFVNVTAYFLDRAHGRSRLLHAQEVRFDDPAAHWEVPEDFALMGFKP
jgi:SAM-dependent methyltransferase